MAIQTMSIALLVMMAICASAMVPSIETDGNAISLNANVVNIQTDSTTVQSIQGMFSTMQKQIDDLTTNSQKKIDDLTANSTAQINQLNAKITALETNLNDNIDNALNRNSTLYKWASNMDPAAAASQGFSNDLTVFIGEFRGNAVVHIDVSEGGWYGNWAASFQINGRWGVHKAQESEFYLPECFSFGSADETVIDNEQVRFFVRAIDRVDGSGQADHSEIYYVYMYIKPYPIIENTPGTVPSYHYTRVTKTFLQDPYGASTYAQSDAAPDFSIADYEDANAGKFLNIPIQLAATQKEVVQKITDMNTPEFIGPSVAAYLNYNQTVYKWTSNYNVSFATKNGLSNDFAALIGHFYTNSVIHVDIADDGHYGNFAASFEINGRWGVNLAGDYGPECFSFGAADEVAMSNLKFYIRAADNVEGSGKADSTTSFYLYVYMPPYRPVGVGETGLTHTTIITTKLSQDPYKRSKFVPKHDNFPAFTYDDVMGDNDGKYYELPVQILSDGAGVIDMVDAHYGLNDTTYNWNSNLNVQYAADNNLQNTVSMCLGTFPINSVLHIDVTESGYYAGWGVTFQTVAGWGVHTDGGVNESRISKRVEAMAIGTAEEWRLNGGNPQLQAYVRAKDLKAGSDLADHSEMYYLYLYVKPYGQVGNGQTPYPHQTRVNIRIANDPSNRGTFSAPDAPAFDIDEFRGNNANSFAYLPIQTILKS
eukprot:m.257205 g.257205  ORF g.257205 m.257205 type:complete len:709 (-) comp35054_c0_seq1:59-2185(-)